MYTCPLAGSDRNTEPVAVKVILSRSEPLLLKNTCLLMVLIFVSDLIGSRGVPVVARSVS